MADDDSLERLNNLKRRLRTPYKEGLVRAMLAQTEDIDDQIRKLEIVDLMPEEEGPPEGAKKARGVILRPEKTPEVEAPEPTLPEPPAPDPVPEERSRVEERRSTLVRPWRQGTLWLYLTKEFAAMVQFGARTSTLTRGWFFFTLRLSPEAQGFLHNVLRAQVLGAIDPFLALALRKAWVHLSRYDYNLLVALSDLTKRIAAVEIAEEDRWGGGPAWDPVLPALRLFWTSPDLVNRTIRAWESAASKLGNPEKVRTAGVEAIRTLLESRGEALSLPDVLQAVLSLRGRRLFEWTEDEAPDPGDYVLRDAFECTPEVQAEIDKAADVLIGQLEALDREAQEIRRIRYFLPPKDLLSDWVGSDKRDDPKLWCRPFLVKVEAAFAPLLGGTVVFADGSRTELMRNPGLDSILARLKILGDQMTSPEALNNPDVLPTVGRVVMNLGKSLVVLIRSRSKSADPLIRASERPEDPLPFEDSVLELPAEWAGLRVIDALVLAAQISLQAGRSLGETSLEANLAKEEGLPSRAAELLGRLEKLVPSTRMAGLRARWG